MADTKITDMATGTLSADDLLTFVDDPAGTPVNKKIAFSTLESGLSLTESQISDLGTYATTAYVDAAVAGLYDHKGAYNASTNSPDLDTSPSGVLKGDAYTVSVAGTFFTAAVDAGDVLIADQDSPTLESHWTIVNRNIDESAFATASHTHATADITSGTFADARIAESNVTQHEAALTITESQISDLGTYSTTGHAHAASDITSGTLPHERGGLEVDVSSFAGVPLIDGGVTSEIKYNLTATTDPGAGDDSGDGYTIGSRWVNVTLDKEFVCLDATVGAAVWTETTAAAGGGTGDDEVYKYLQHSTTGQSLWRTSPTIGVLTASATLTLVANRLYAIPFFVAETQTPDRINLSVTTSQAVNVRMGIYNSASGVPATLLLDAGEVSASTTGDKEITISQELTPGMHFLVMVSNGTPTVDAIDTADLLCHYGTNSPANDTLLTLLYGTHTYAALPSSFPTISRTISDLPKVSLRF